MLLYSRCPKHIFSSTSSDTDIDDDQGELSMTDGILWSFYRNLVVHNVNFA